ncbi:hypothetical protein [Nocardiopsis rhodophaea]|uniref:hypothetical protein n=1 Tax=Nocardiopsis rhodophaea TaxID=280238 RepID=UPI0031DDF124
MAEKNRRTRRTLNAVRRKYSEALDLDDDRVVFDGEDGETYSFPHPLFADDTWTQAVDDASTTSGKASAILGEEQYDKFRAHPDHRDADVMLMFLDVNQSMQDELTDGRPTRS